MTTVASGAGDVLWSLGFFARFAWVIVLLSALPAAQRIFAALHPDDPRVYAWPVEALVGLLRIAAIVVVFWLGWRADAALRRPEVDSVGRVLGALVDYVRHDGGRLLVAALIAGLVLNLLGGPVVEAVVRQFSTDPRVAAAWSFGVRNLVMIPLFSALAYGLLRPALLAPTS
ncbi:hypothetical protein [Homoserinibacter gongjuensis]|uniref:Uncharacterized protein n=1 Tax=Homoserinibacter gongjuensis TaxID=1162968 RepID=A0ABQ6JYT4_9MICO|nr:hypothetical protein [Homoserinibacter gongjuensis]GMA92812.1 hypothetical protein GCM10025869_33410 [Homoserinibacter gongjuensis]